MAAPAEFNHLQPRTHGPLHKPVLHMHIKGMGPLPAGMTAVATVENFVDRFLTTFGGAGIKRVYMAIFTDGLAWLGIGQIGGVDTTLVVDIYRSVGKIVPGGRFFFVALDPAVDFLYVDLVRDLGDAGMASTTRNPSMNRFGEITFINIENTAAPRNIDPSHPSMLVAH